MRYESFWREFEGTFLPKKVPLKKSFSEVSIHMKDMLKKSIFIFLFASLIFAAGEAPALNTGNGPALFHTGERLYLEGRLPMAREYYKAYLSQSPQPQWIDDALFRLGQISIFQNDFPVALRYFDIILTQLRSSDLTGRARLKKALCQFRMGNTLKAARNLNELLRTSADPDLRYEAHALLGRCWTSRESLPQAIESFLNALREAPEKKKQVMGLVFKAISKEEDPKLLLELSEAGNDPLIHGQALLRLLDIYLDQREFGKFLKIAPSFLKRFPGHPDFKMVSAKLLDIKGDPEAHKTRIGVVLPLTGKAALQGEQILKGIQLAFGSSASMGEIDLMVKDSAGDPATAVRAVRKLAGDPSVIAILGPAFSKVADKLAPLSEELKVPILSPASSSVNYLSEDPYFFRNSMTGETEAREMAEYAVNILGLKKFAIIYPDSPYGKELTAFFEKNVASLGGEVMAVESYPLKEVDFSELIRKIGGMDDEHLKKEAISIAKKSGTGEPPDFDPDRLSIPSIEGGLWNTFDQDKYHPFLKFSYEAVFIPGYFEKAGLIIPQMEFYNIEGVKLLGSSSWNTDRLTRITRGHPEDFYFVDGFYAGSGAKRVRNFIERYNSFFGESPDILAAQAYDAAMMLLNSYQSGGKSRSAIREGLKKIKGFPGVSGLTTILDSGDAEKRLFVLTVSRGKIVESKR